MAKRRKRSYKSKLKLLMQQSHEKTIHPIMAQQQANMLASLCLPGHHKNWQRQQLEKDYIARWQIEL